MNNAWLNQLWKRVKGPARMARRKASTVVKYSTEKDLIAKARKQRFHVAKVGVQYFVFRDPIDVKA